MSEPTSPFPAALEWDQHPQPSVWVIPPPRQRWWLHILLLAATFLSTMLVGAHMQSNFAAHRPVFSINDDITLFLESIWQSPSRFLSGIPFSLTLIFFFLAPYLCHSVSPPHFRFNAPSPFFTQY